MAMMIRNALMRFRRMTPARLYQDHARARKLLRGAAPAPALATRRPERLVVTLTTVPERMDRLSPVLHSLLDQTVAADRIVLARPEVSRRSGTAYPHLVPPFPAST